MTLPFDLKLIDPGNDDGHKYSQNFFRFLRKFEKDNTYSPTEVFATVPGRHLYVGYAFDGDIIGAQMLGGQILSDGARTEVYSMGGRDFERVEGFWDLYLRVGRCAIDPEHKIHFQCGDRRFDSVSEDIRSCRWCGVKQKRTRWTEVVERQHERWDAEATDGNHS